MGDAEMMAALRPGIRDMPGDNLVSLAEVKSGLGIENQAREISVGPEG